MKKSKKNIIKTDDIFKAAFSIYEMTKKKETDVALYAYDYSINQFIRLTESIEEKVRNGSGQIIYFMNTYEECLNIIDNYLAQSHMAKYRASAYSEMEKHKKGKVIGFLWYFEHIDGCYSFNSYEEKKAFERIEKWLKTNDISYQIDTVDSTVC